MQHDGKTKVAVIGAGQEGLKILSLMRKDPDVSLMMLVDPDKSAIGFRLAEYGYRFTSDLDLGLSHRLQSLSSIHNLNLIIDTEPGKYHKDIYSVYLHPAEIMNGSSAGLVWDLKSKTDMEERRHLISDRLNNALEVVHNSLAAIPHAHALNEISALLLRAALLGTHAVSSRLTILSKDRGYRIIKDICTGPDLFIKKGRLISPSGEDYETDSIIKTVVEKREVYHWDSGRVIPVLKDDGITAMIWLYYAADNINFTGDDVSFIQSHTALFGKSIENALDSEKARVQDIENRLLTEPSKIIRSEKPMGQKLNDVNRTLRRLTGAEDSHIYMKDPATGDLVLQATTLKLPFLTGDIRIRSGAGILGEVMERKNLITLSEDNLTAQFAKREDALSIMYLPLVARGEGVGIIAMEFTCLHNLTRGAVTSLDDIGQELAVSVSNDVERHRMSRKILKLYTVNEEGIEILSTVDIEKIAALSSSSSAMLLDSEIAIVRFIENEKPVIKSTCGLQLDKTDQILLDIDNELANTVMQTKIPAMIHDLSEYAEARTKHSLSGDFHYKTSMVLPVIFERKVIGTLSFYNKIASEIFSSLIFSDDDREIAERFIQYIARGIINAKRYSEKQSLITIDDLTGLRNERYLQMRFPEEINRAKRYNRSVSLIFLDVKPADDILINDVSRLVKETFRYIDVLVRLKDAKFAILLPDTGQTVRDATTRIASALSVLKEKRPELAVYAGYSTYPYDSEDMHELIKKASKLKQY